MADDSWRVGVDLAFATNGFSEPLASSPTTPRRAQSDLEDLDEWWGHQANALNAWDDLQAAGTESL